MSLITQNLTETRPEQLSEQLPKDITKYWAEHVTLSFKPYILQEPFCIRQSQDIQLRKPMVKKTNGEENSKQRWINEIRQKLKNQIRQTLKNYIKLKIIEIPKQELSEDDKKILEQVMQLKFEIQFNQRFQNQFKQKVSKNFTQKMEEQLKLKAEAEIKQNIIKIFIEKVEKELQTAVGRRILYKIQYDLSKIKEKEKEREKQKEQAKKKEEQAKKKEEQAKKKENQRTLWQSIKSNGKTIIYGIIGIASALLLYNSSQILNSISQSYFRENPDHWSAFFARRRIKDANELDLRGYTCYQKFAMIKEWDNIDFGPELKDFVKDSVSKDIQNIINDYYQILKIMVLYGRDGIGKTSGLLNFVVEQKKKTKDRIPVFYICLRSQASDNKKNKKQQKQKKQKKQQQQKKQQKQQKRSYFVFAKDVLKFQGMDIINLLINVKRSGRYFQFLKYLGQQGFNINQDSDQKKRLILIIDEINALKDFLQKSDPMFHNADQLLKCLYLLNTSLFQIVSVSSDKQFTQNELVSCSTLRNDKFQFFQIKLSKEDFRKYLEAKGSKFGLDKDQKALALITNYYNNKRDAQNVLRIYQQIKQKQGQQKARGQQRAREEIKKSIQKQLVIQKNQFQNDDHQEIDKDLIQVFFQRKDRKLKNKQYLIDKNIIYSRHFKKLMTQRAFELYYDEIRKKKGEGKQKWTPTQCENLDGFTMAYSQKVHLVN